MKTTDKKTFNGKKISFTIFLVLISSIFVGMASAATWTVCSSGCDYTSIQDAINVSSNGDTVQVQSGKYYEKVMVVDKAWLTLQGVDTGGGKPVIDGSGTGTPLTLDTYYVTVDGFAVTNGSGHGIFIPGVAGDPITITNSTISGNSGNGIYTQYLLSLIITNNTISYNGGIGVQNSGGMVADNTISYNGGHGVYGSGTFIDNTISYNGNDGIHFRGGGTIADNIISGNGGYGIDFYSGLPTRPRGGDSTCGTLLAIGNNISGNTNGVSIGSDCAGSYTIYNNYFNTNNFNLFSSGTLNTTQTAGTNIVGGPYLGGNFWADPSGTGFSQTCTDVNQDGICDTIYALDENNIDYLPLSMNFTSDATPPTTTIALSGTLGNNSWYISDAKVTLTATDNDGGSGVQKTEYGFDGTNWNQYTGPFTIPSEGITTVYYRSTDNADNVESTKTQIVEIDKTPPQITINTPANGGVYPLNQTLIADWSATDSLSGIASATGTFPNGAAIDTATVGTKAFVVVATDNADNTITQTAPYTIIYNFLGILPPIREDGSSIFKMGSTIPVKFRIADANGNYVSTATANLTYQKITDEVLGTVEEAVSTSAANEGNIFRYDSSDNLYIFNLGTEGMDTGTYQLNINLDDGTVRTVLISLR